MGSVGKQSAVSVRRSHVAIEGLDGSGKSTLISNVTERLRGEVEVKAFRLPDQESVAGRDLIDIVSMRQVSPSPAALALAFAANRTDSYERRVVPYLAEDGERLALWDRYVLSGLAYQGMQGVDIPWLLALNQAVPPPDLTIFIDTDPDECRARIQRRGGRPELFEVDFETVRHSFLAAIDVLRAAGWLVEVLSGGVSPAVLAKDAIDLVRG